LRSMDTELRILVIFRTLKKTGVGPLPSVKGGRTERGKGEGKMKRER